MNAWLIVSICLYIVGLLPALNWNIDGYKNPKWKVALETIFWPLIIPAVITGMGIIELLVMIRRMRSKYFFILLLITFCGCDMGERTDPQEDIYIMPDSIAGHEPDTVKMPPLYIDTGEAWSVYETSGVWYDVWISSPNGCAAYKKRDSAWVIFDSVETFKRLLFMAELQSKMYKK